VKEKQKRFRMACELRTAQTGDDGKMIIEGRAVVFNSPTKLFTYDGVDYFEIIDAKAFEGCEIKDCCLKYNHSDSALILARMRGGSLSIEVRDDGVYFRAELFDTQFSRDCYALIEQGALQCSFAFIISPDGEEYDRNTHTRTVRHIERLLDISVVTLPAYEDTWVKEARTAFDLDGEQAKLESEKRAKEERRRALIARTIYTTEEEKSHE